MLRLATALTAAALCWTALIVAVPLLTPRGSHPIWAEAVRAVGAVVCHQRPDRSFHVSGAALPVCARCTGLYVSGTLGALLGWMGVPRTPRRMRVWLAAAASFTVITFAAEWTGLAATTNLVRAAAALPLGGVAGWCFVRMLRAEERPTTCVMIS